MNDEALRTLYQEALARRRAQDRAPCPVPESLRALAEREGDDTERLEVLDHVMTCEPCRRDLELLRAIRQAAPSWFASCGSSGKCRS